jgi:hypothetical protein
MSELSSKIIVPLEVHLHGPTLTLRDYAPRGLEARSLLRLELHLLHLESDGDSRMAHLHRHLRRSEDLPPDCCTAQLLYSWDPRRRPGTDADHDEFVNSLCVAAACDTYCFIGAAPHTFRSEDAPQIAETYGLSLDEVKAALAGIPPDWDHFEREYGSWPSST